MSANSTPDLIIDPNGDIILSLTKLSPSSTFTSTSTTTTTQVLVSSRILSLCSPVFSKIFSSQFREGVDINRSLGRNLHLSINHASEALEPSPSSGPSSKDSSSKWPIIPLPDEDAEAFILLCNALHYRMDKVPRKPGIAVLEKIVRIVDKWDFGTAVAGITEALLQNWIDTTPSLTTFANFNTRLLFVAYGLDAARQFSKISWEILIAEKGQFEKLGGLLESDLVPGSLLVHFQARKAALDLAVIRAIDAPLCSINSDNLYAHSADALKQLRSQSLWPIAGQKISLKSIFERYKNMKDLATPAYKAVYCSKPSTIAPQLRQGIAKIQLIEKGLCLDCVKTEGRSAAEKKYRLCIPML